MSDSTKKYVKILSVTGAIVSFSFLIFAILYRIDLTKKHEANIAKIEELEKAVYQATEEAYFEGQKDAIDGDVRIEKDEQGTYHWTKSCWDNGRKPLFDPSTKDSTNTSGQ